MLLISRNSTFYKYLNQRNYKIWYEDTTFNRHETRFTSVINTLQYKWGMQNHKELILKTRYIPQGCNIHVYSKLHYNFQFVLGFLSSCFTSELCQKSCAANHNKVSIIINNTFIYNFIFTSLKSRFLLFFLI